MNPDNKKNADVMAKQSREFIRAKNKRIRAHNRDVMLRNFIRTHK